MKIWVKLLVGSGFKALNNVAGDWLDSFSLKISPLVGQVLKSDTTCENTSRWELDDFVGQSDAKQAVTQWNGRQTLVDEQIACH